MQKLFSVLVLLICILCCRSTVAMEEIDLPFRDVIKRSELVVYGQLYKKEGGLVYIKIQRYLKNLASSGNTDERQLVSSSENIFFDLNTYTRQANLLGKSVYVFGKDVGNAISIDQSDHILIAENSSSLVTDILSYSEINGKQDLLAILLKDVVKKPRSVLAFLDQNTDFPSSEFVKAFALSHLLHAGTKDRYVTDFVLNNAAELPQSMVYVYFTEYNAHTYRFDDVIDQKRKLFDAWNKSKDFKERKLSFTDKLKSHDVKKYLSLTEKPFINFRDEVFSIYDFFLDRNLSDSDDLNELINAFLKEEALADEEKERRSHLRYLQRRFEKSSIFVDQEGVIQLSDRNLNEQIAKDVRFAAIALDHVQKHVSTVVAGSKIFVQEKSENVFVYILRSADTKKIDQGYHRIIIDSLDGDVVSTLSY